MKDSYWDTLMSRFANTFVGAAQLPQSLSYVDKVLHKPVVESSAVFLRPVKPGELPSLMGNFHVPFG